MDGNEGANQSLGYYSTCNQLQDDCAFKCHGRGVLIRAVGALLEDALVVECTDILPGHSFTQL
jgi:hypothetical protein